MERKEDEKNEEKVQENWKKKEDKIIKLGEESLEKEKDTDTIYIYGDVFMTKAKIVNKLRIHKPIAVTIKQSSDQLTL